MAARRRFGSVCCLRRCSSWSFPHRRFGFGGAIFRCGFVLSGVAVGLPSVFSPFLGGTGIPPVTCGCDFDDDFLGVGDFSTSARFVVLRSGVIRRGWDEEVVLVRHSCIVWRGSLNK